MLVYQRVWLIFLASRWSNPRRATPASGFRLFQMMGGIPLHWSLSEKFNLNGRFHNWMLATSILGGDKTPAPSNIVNELLVESQLTVNIVPAIQPQAAGCTLTLVSLEYSLLGRNLAICHELGSPWQHRTPNIEWTVKWSEVCWVLFQGSLAKWRIHANPFLLRLCIRSIADHGNAIMPHDWKQKIRNLHIQICCSCMRWSSHEKFQGRWFPDVPSQIYH